MAPKWVLHLVHYHASSRDWAFPCYLGTVIYIELSVSGVKIRLAPPPHSRPTWRENRKDNLEVRSERKGVSSRSFHTLTQYLRYQAPFYDQL
jgi:hypothetical protein